MKHLPAILFAAVLFTSHPASAAPTFFDGVTQGSESNLSLQAAFVPAPDDVGKPISLFVAAIFPAGNLIYAKTPGGWVPASASSIPQYLSNVSAAASHTVDIVQSLDASAFAGTLVYIGYGLENSPGETPFEEMLRNQRYRLVYTFPKSAGTSSPQGAPKGPAYIASCPADIATPLFGTVPVEVKDFLAFRPLGFMSTPIHMFPAKHSAFSMTPIGQSAVQKPVRAPGKATVTEIYEASFSTGGKNYQVFMHPCSEVRAYFGHLATISARLAAEFGNGTPKCNSFDDGTATVTTCRRENLNLQLDEGEVFGMGPDSAGVDFGTLDFRRPPAAFINLAHYDYYYPYYTSPLDFFTPAARKAIEDKTGNIFGTRMRTAAPLGGTYMQDLPGTAQGNWFLPGKYHSNTTDMSQFLGLAHDYVDPAQPLMAAGTSIQGMKLGLYSHKVEQSGLDNRDFGAIKPDGNVYCIDGFMQGQSAGGVPIGKPGGILLLAMPDDTHLTVELAAGSSCGAATSRTFSAGATKFER